MTISGQCFCGSVRYRIEGELKRGHHCHCSMCRRTHGAAYASYARVSPESLTWTAGDDLLSAYELSPGTGRLFCRNCGSILAYKSNGSVSSVTMGTLDGDPAVREMHHVFVGSKAPWHEIGDGLPQYEEWPPA